MFRVLLPLKSSLPTLPNPHISFLGTEEIKPRCDVLIVWAPNKPHMRTQKPRPTQVL